MPPTTPPDLPGPPGLRGASGVTGPVRDDPAWLYQGLHGGVATRHLQVWAGGPGRVVAVVTEHPDDAGTGITNAAEHIVAQLHAEYPGQQIDVIEHHTPLPVRDDPATYQRSTLTNSTGQSVELPPQAETIPADTWHRVTLDPRGRATWQALPPTHLPNPDLIVPNPDLPDLGVPDLDLPAGPDGARLDQVAAVEDLAAGLEDGLGFG